ncbi:hypothetical protein GLYMA_05G080300v4 [Glycine max]|uniref:Uncharacterized protein n=3 Tax=Glycine subgen. Soja TaxID=1462606 RepID=K7KNY4_SOYBN|nr:hypothetical protein GLYMA_05G080300v4 [Glycine max]RZC11512.1 hypothetical protein D0Y65_011627 [Glycine soja]
MLGINQGDSLSLLLLRSGVGGGIYFIFSSRAHDCFGFLHHGSRLLGWWSIDEGSQEEQARLYHEGAIGWGYHLVLLQLTKLSTSVVKGPS